MTSSLVGSEMCIRDRSKMSPPMAPEASCSSSVGAFAFSYLPALFLPAFCLLYTSDAADDM
eukprot:7273847-Prorocentrum_lima.AAC.1